MKLLCLGAPICQFSLIGDPLTLFKNPAVVLILLPYPREVQAGRQAGNMFIGVDRALYSKLKSRLSILDPGFSLVFKGSLS